MGDTFLSQWVNKDQPAAQGPAKQHEFSVYIPPLLEILDIVGAARLVDVQADEGVVSAAFCMSDPHHHATFLLPRATDDPEGTFRSMARTITAELRGQGRITLVADASEIETDSADAIVYNNILGCQGSLDNVQALVDIADRVVGSEGYAVVTVPNPNGEEFSSYRCSDLPEDRRHGGIYKFQMAGEADVFENLYLTKEGLSAAFEKAGFALVQTKPLADKPYEGRVSEQPAFYQYLFQRLE